MQSSVPLTRGTPAAYAPAAPRVAVRSLRTLGCEDMRKLIFILLALIAGALAWAILYPAINHEPGIRRDQIEVHAIKSALQAYHNDWGKYPPEDFTATIRELCGGNSRQIMYLEPDNNPDDGNWTDPWGHEYQIILTGTTPIVRSAGPDGMLGNRDDSRTDK